MVFSDLDLSNKKGFSWNSSFPTAGAQGWRLGIYRENAVAAQLFGSLFSVSSIYQWNQHRLSTETPHDICFWQKL